MKKITVNFILTSLIKGVLLFLLILIGDFFEVIPIALRFVVFFIVIGVIDWQMLNRIKNEILEYQFIKTLAFSYISFVAILWITGPLFQLYNNLANIAIEEEPKMPTLALVIFLTSGLISSLISSMIWTRKNKKLIASK